MYVNDYKTSIQYKIRYNACCLLNYKGMHGFNQIIVGCRTQRLEGVVNIDDTTIRMANGVMVQSG